MDEQQRLILRNLMAELAGLTDQSAEPAPAPVPWWVASVQAAALLTCGGLPVLAATWLFCR